MAAVEVTITGTLYDKLNRTTQQVVLIGEASLTGLGIGGGPIIPPGQPPGFWGPNDPRPTPPIANVPGIPGYQPPGQPPGIWGPTDPRPTPPIPVYPGGSPEPPKPPDPVEPPIEWKAVWHPTEGWIVVGIPQFPTPTPS